jgi:hypothetical protein
MGEKTLQIEDINELEIFYKKELDADRLSGLSVTEKANVKKNLTRTITKLKELVKEK